jgi:hypothetical protein
MRIRFKLIVLGALVAPPPATPAQVFPGRSRVRSIGQQVGQDASVS